MSLKARLSRLEPKERAKFVFQRFTFEGDDGGDEGAILFGYAYGCGRRFEMLPGETERSFQMRVDRICSGMADLDHLATLEGAKP